MLSIHIPNNNIIERRYVISILLNDFLGIDYKLELVDSSNKYSIKFNNSEISFFDSFFNNYPEPLSYLDYRALPQDIPLIKNEFIPEKDLPALFGDNQLLVTENRIDSGLDIFASSFFLLSRWEEYVNEARDKHKRFQGKDSIAYKNGFLHRPLVNEYVETLWQMLLKLGYPGKRKKKEFGMVLTHDVDGLRYVSPKTIAGDVIKRRKLKVALRNSKYLFKKDPYDTFDFLMDISERLNVKSRFYLMSTNSRMDYDTGYYLNTRRFRSRIRRVKDRGHILGFHPGYYTHRDLERWTQEKNVLEVALSQEITEGRQHFLRFDVPQTFTIWEKNSMTIDSTLGYADMEGFRCGTGDEFTVFDFLQRKSLKLKERPLILMDGTLLDYRNYSKEKVMDVFRYYVSIGRKYNTTITILFHNSSFFGAWERYDSVYEELLNV